MEKSFFESKTAHFNSWSALLVYAIWPFVPEAFRKNDWAIHTLTAWFTIGNLLLRVVTSEAVYLWKKKNQKADDAR